MLLFRYMEGFAPLPAYLPVKVSLVIASKAIRFDGVVLKTTDSITDVRSILASRLVEFGNPLVSIPASSYFILKRYMS